MKTAMQHLKKHLKNMVSNGGDMDLLCVIEMIDNKYLNQEKEQIMVGYSDGNEDGLNNRKGNSTNYYKFTYKK
jgi:phosphoenolpyruvate carboxylase